MTTKTKTNDWKHIYVVLSKSNLVKVGVSSNPKRRFRSIETSSGYEIVDKLVLPKCSNSYEIENHIHKCFSKYRRKGEWFEADFEEVANVAMMIYQNTCKYVLKESTHKSEDLIDFLHFKNPSKMFESGFSEQFIDMAIELGKRMQEIRYLKEILDCGEA